MSDGERTGKPPAPDHLGESGRAFWAAMMDGLTWDASELELLAAAARTVDDIAELDAAIERDGYTTTSAAGAIKVNPCVTEVRQQRATLAKLVASLRVPDDEGTRPQRRGGARGVRGHESRVPRIRSV